MRARIFVVVLLLAVTAAVAFGFFFGKRPLPAPPAPEPAEGVTWQGVRPGTTTKDELVGLLGPPASRSATGNTEMLFYPSTNQYWRHQVAVRGNSVGFVREYVFAPADTSFKNRLKNFTTVPVRLYGPDSLLGVFAFVFLDQGVGFVANEGKDRVYEVWYFTPLPLRDFLLLPEVKGYSLQQRAQPDI